MFPSIKKDPFWLRLLFFPALESLFGILAILDGAKGFVRWTLWPPQIPLFGIQLGETASAIVQMALGAPEAAIGMAALRQAPRLLRLGLVYYGLVTASALAGRRLLPGWIEASVVARRAYQGLPVRDGEVEFMQSIMPAVLVFGPLLMGGWLLLVLLRFSKR
ncbi:MAG TPA: hypothetical protein VFP98_09660 [Candidatus Polarisedimenticolia bacterium]|nr:hypothetical protein [Candidatus Polarisedimenticolia bacterium]